MGDLRFSFLIIKNNFRQFTFHIVAIGLAVCFIFMNLLLLFNSNFYKISEPVPTIYLTTICGSIILMNYINSYFIKSRTKEMGVIAIGGTSVYKISRILLIENLFIVLLGTVVGVFLTVIFTNNLYPLLFSEMGAENPSFLNITTILIVLAVVGLLFFQIIFCNLGFFIRKEVNEILIENKPFVKVYTGNYKQTHLLFVLVYFLPAIAFLFPVSLVDRGMYICFFSMFSAYGSYGVMRYVLPLGIKELKERVFVNSKVMSIVLSNVASTIYKCWIQTLSVIILNSIALIFFPFYDKAKEIEFFTGFSFFVTLLIMVFAIGYQIISDGYVKRKNYDQLLRVGFYKKDIRKINYLEVILSFLLISMVASIPTLLMSIPNTISGVYSYGFGIAISIGTIGVPLVSSIFVSIVYRGIVLKRIGGKR